MADSALSLNQQSLSHNLDATTRDSVMHNGSRMTPSHRHHPKEEGHYVRRDQYLAVADRTRHHHPDLWHPKTAQARRRPGWRREGLQTGHACDRHESGHQGSWVQPHVNCSKTWIDLRQVKHTVERISEPELPAPPKQQPNAPCDPSVMAAAETLPPARHTKETASRCATPATIWIPARPR